MCSGAVRKLAKVNILSVPNLIGWDEVLNTGFHKKYILENYVVRKKT